MPAELSALFCLSRSRIQLMCVNVTNALSINWIDILKLTDKQTDRWMNKLTNRKKDIVDT